ncbi:MAG: hypothetical protein JW801_19085 [Bacteroidales bacterium]|nr:hypothetical protein [Bacteroidales bacterium]
MSLLRWSGILVLAVVLGLAVDAQSGEPYREFVDMHVPRTDFVAGENMALKAYCFSNQDDPAEFFSKVLYIEILDKEGGSLLSQVLEVESNSAATLVSLPDTLRTGSYTVKAYTNWMKNFGDRYFYSQPIFVYNPFNNDAEAELAGSYQLFEPRVFIEGGKLIADNPVRMKIVDPGNIKPGLKGQLTEDLSGSVIREFSLDKSGEHILRFSPRSGNQYALRFGDSTLGFQSFSLPEVDPAAYLISIDSLYQGVLAVTVCLNNERKDPLNLCLRKGERILKEERIYLEEDRKQVLLEVPASFEGVYTLELMDQRGQVVASQEILSKAEDQISKRTYGIHDRVKAEFDLMDSDILPEAGFSACVHKKENYSGSFQSAGWSGLKIAGGIELILPREYSVMQQGKSTRKGNLQAEYMVEDLGILYTGYIMNPMNNSPLSDLEVVLALKDTLGVILSSKTDQDGKFCILLNEQQNKDAYISLYLNYFPISGNFSLLLDQKYYFKALRNGHQVYFENAMDPGLNQEMKDEADRVLIQRVFENLWTLEGTAPEKLSFRDRRFYGEPMITVHPGEFFFLPNFEEIAREILPRVRYKHNEDECELILSHVENGVRAANPIILVDGNMVTDACKLYDLNSDDIQRVEIKTGSRTSGNLFYSGVLAIYTTELYKKKNGRQNGRTSYPVPGYVNNDQVLVMDSLQGKADAGSNTPDFRNMLYWNPRLNADDDGKVSFEFFTSDEEGDYIIELVGFTAEGVPVSQYQLIHVNAN